MTDPKQVRQAQLRAELQTLLAQTEKCKEPRSTKKGGKAKLGGIGIQRVAAPHVIKRCQSGRPFDSEDIRNDAPELRIYQKRLAIGTALGLGVGGVDKSTGEQPGMGLWHYSTAMGCRFVPCRENALLAIKSQAHRLDELARDCGYADIGELLEAVQQIPTKEQWEIREFGLGAGGPITSPQSAPQPSDSGIDPYAELGRKTSILQFDDSVPESHRLIIHSNDVRVNDPKKPMLDEAPESANYGQVAHDQTVMRQRVKGRQRAHQRICNANDNRAIHGVKLWDELVGGATYNTGLDCPDQERAWRAWETRTGKERPANAPRPDARAAGREPQSGAAEAAPAKESGAVSQTAPAPLGNEAPSAAPLAQEDGDEA
jgi:hypothetical protein